LFAPSPHAALTHSCMKAEVRTSLGRSGSRVRRSLDRPPRLDSPRWWAGTPKVTVSYREVALPEMPYLVHSKGEQAGAWVWVWVWVWVCTGVSGMQVCMFVNAYEKGCMQRRTQLMHAERECGCVCVEGGEREARRGEVQRQ
jgi:hypothetical protein